ncbi:MAG: cation-translocating P-type ATPase [Oligoflexia bacterium]|nr:cation-translocating P-type ATPase [Oligoflexia bacterium]
MLPESLTDDAARRLRERFGPNELPQAERKTPWKILGRIVREPMILLLVATASIYLTLGDLEEGLLLGFSVFFVLWISLYQELKSERALDALRELASPRAMVIRDGKERRVAASELVPGDLIALYEGDRIPADAELLWSAHLQADESLLTGESMPAAKRPGIAPESTVYSSCLIVKGRGLARVTETGSRTAVGKIGKSLQQAPPASTRLSREIRQLVVLFAVSGSIVCVAIILVYGFRTRDWAEATLVGLAAEMSLLPEEFPVVLAIFTALGAWRLAKAQVLVRRPEAIERLGAITALCVDKTGTLTQNRMTVLQLAIEGSLRALDGISGRNLPEEFHEIAEWGVLASHRDPFDPMEKAILRLLVEHEWGREHLHSDWTLVREYPLSEELLAMSCVWTRAAEPGALLIASKGAPEAMIRLCRLPPERAERILDQVAEMAVHGLRVIGVARAGPLASLPKSQEELPFRWVGLIGLRDPIRPEVPEAVRLCREAGIRLIMMTGDHPETALRIALEAGIDTRAPVVQGRDLEELDEPSLMALLKEATVFSRMVPEQKLKIVRGLKQLDEVVAMTGDGVNDAPSLRWADVGISMGARGTDVAREASDIVLLDDNFASIVGGIARGRAIYGNIRRALSYLAAVHVPIAGLAIMPVILGWPILLLPAHIVFLELVIDPACSLAFESIPAAPEEMHRPPRPVRGRLFAARDLLRSAFQGALILVVGLLLFRWSLHNGHTSDQSRAQVFIFMLLSNIGLILADVADGRLSRLGRAFRNPVNSAIVIGAPLLLAAILAAPHLRKAFAFEPITSLETLLSLGLAAAVSTFIGFWVRRTA